MQTKEPFSLKLLSIGALPLSLACPVLNFQDHESVENQFLEVLVRHEGEHHWSQLS